MKYVIMFEFHSRCCLRHVPCEIFRATFFSQFSATVPLPLGNLEENVCPSAQSWKNNLKMSSPRGAKSRKLSRIRVKTDYFSTISTFDSFSTQFSTFWAPGPLHGGELIFRLLSSNFGPEGPKVVDPSVAGPGVKKFLPTTGSAGKCTFWCGRGRPRFSARTSMTRRVVEKLCTKKVCVDFSAPRNLKRSFRNFLRNLLRNLPRNSPRNISCFPGR